MSALRGQIRTLPIPAHILNDVIATGIVHAYAYNFHVHVNVLDRARYSFIYSWNRTLFAVLITTLKQGAFPFVTPSLEEHQL